MRNQKPTSTQDSRRESFISIFETLLQAIETEISSLPETLQKVSPEKRLEFISKTLPHIFRFKEWDGETLGGVWD